MKETQFSHTALLTAIYRCYHSVNDEPKIFNDFKAQWILKKEEIDSFEHHMVDTMKSFDPKFASSFPNDAAILAFMMQSMAVTPLVLCRARYAEDNLIDAIHHGIQQYVILGAGMDTFIFRHPEILGQLNVFEVDHPSTQKFKLERLAELEWVTPERLVYISGDFTKMDLSTILMHNKFYDRFSLSFFNWMGVSYYLPSGTVFKTLHSFAKAAQKGSKIAFDYFDLNAFNPQKSAQRVQILFQLAQQEDEIMQFGMDPALLAEELSKVGLRLIENLNPYEIQLRYFADRNDKYYACEHAHLALAEVI